MAWAVHVAALFLFAARCHCSTHAACCVPAPAHRLLRVERKVSKDGRMCAFCCEPESKEACIKKDSELLKVLSKSLTMAVTKPVRRNSLEFWSDTRHTSTKRVTRRTSTKLMLRFLGPADADEVSRMIRRSINSDLVSQAKRLELCTHYYGVKPTIGNSVQHYLQSGSKRGRDVYAFGVFRWSSVDDSYQLLATTAVEKRGASAYIGMVYAARECVGRGLTGPLMRMAFKVAKKWFGSTQITLDATYNAVDMYAQKYKFEVVKNQSNAANAGMYTEMNHMIKQLYSR